MLNNVFVLFLMISMVGCTASKEKTAMVATSDIRPVIDGKVDECWEKLPDYPIDGSLVGEINWEGEQDLSASFRVLKHEDDLFFLVKVIDDIEGKIESSTLDQYWENDNMEFFFTKGQKRAQEDLTDADSIYFVNYSSPFDRLEEMVNITESKAEYVSFGRTSIKGGYLLEAAFKGELGIFDFEKEVILFNIELSDNDNRNLEEGFVQGRESGIAWSYNSARNSWQETINYGKLILAK